MKLSHSRIVTRSAHLDFSHMTVVINLQAFSLEITSMQSEGGRGGH